MTTYRISFTDDPDPDLSWLEQWNTPAKYKGNEALDGEGNPVPYEEYASYYGNPERHLTLLATLEQQCEKCEEWSVVDVLGGIDYMDDSQLPTDEAFETVDEITNPETRTWARDLLAAGVERLRSAMKEEAP